MKRPDNPSQIEFEALCVRLDPDCMDVLDEFAASEKDEPCRSEAVRRILRDWFVRHGYLND